MVGASRLTGSSGFPPLTDHKSKKMLWWTSSHTGAALNMRIYCWEAGEGVAVKKHHKIIHCEIEVGYSIDPVIYSIYYSYDSISIQCHNINIFIKTASY